MKPGTLSFYEQAVQSAVERIVSDLDGALDLQGLARKAALSPFHFHRVFRGMVGETPLELHRRLRLERAAWQLLRSDSPVTSVAFAAGYETHESFTRAFRERYARAPSELRRDAGADPAACVRPPQIELPARCRIHFQPERAAAPVVHFVQGGFTMNVDIKDMPELRVATVAHVGPYSRIFEAFTRLDQLARQGRLVGPDSALLAIYHDDPETTPAAELRSEAALTVAPGTPLPPPLGERRLPGGRHACTRHVGPYEELGDVWARFMGEWLPGSGHRMRPDADSFEIYRNTPADVPRAELVTELYIPLA